MYYLHNGWFFYFDVKVNLFKHFIAYNDCLSGFNILILYLKKKLIREFYINVYLVNK